MSQIYIAEERDHSGSSPLTQKYPFFEDLDWENGNLTENKRVFSGNCCWISNLGVLFLPEGIER